MKRFNHTIGFFAAAALAACTGDFESFNTNPDAVQSVDKKTYITTMQMDAVIPCSDVGANEFQRACNLMGDAFGGYLSPIQAFNGGSYTCTYDLDGTDYNNVPFSVAFTNVMPAWLNLKYAYQNGQVTDDVFAVAEVIKVMALQRTTDIYGPIPVSNFGQTENPYESQETVYKNLLTDLNAAIAVLKEYAATAPTPGRCRRSTPFTRAAMRNGSSWPTRSSSAWPCASVSSNPGLPGPMPRKPSGTG